jgi:dTMP kinase
MLVKIKRIDTSLPLPQYQTNGAAAFDFVVREDTVVPPKGVGRAPSNIVIEIPQGYMLWVTDRSSTIKKTGLIKTEGVIDSDFCGDNDEILLQFYNPTNEPIKLMRGDRVSQGIFLPVGRAKWQEVREMDNKDRGGFGSTDMAQEYTSDYFLQEREHISRPVTSPYRGKLIVIDGTDGSGKTTQIGRLVNRMLNIDKNVVTADFPQYTTKSAGLIEEYLNGKYGSPSEVSPYIASFFYALDRYDASFKIKTQLDQGNIIITDRYVSANMGHQGGKFDTVEKRKAYFKWLDTYEYEVFNIPRPSLTIILHVPIIYTQETLRTRDNKAYIENSSKLDIHEQDLDHLRSAEQSYVEMCELFPDFVLIECVANGKLLSIEEIHELVWKQVQKIL